MQFLSSLKQVKSKTVEAVVLWLIVIVASFMAISAMFSTPGCSALGLTQTDDGKSVVLVSPDLRAQLEAMDGKLDVVKQVADEALVKAEASGDVRDVAKARDMVQVVNQAVEAREAGKQVIVTDKATGGIDLQGTAMAAGSLLPPPWNVVAPSLVALIASAVQGIKRTKADVKVVESKQALVSTIQHIDKMMVNDPKVMEAFKTVDDRVKNDARTVLTPMAREAIDEYSST